MANGISQARTDGRNDVINHPQDYGIEPGISIDSATLLVEQDITSDYDYSYPFSVTPGEYYAVFVSIDSHADNYRIDGLSCSSSLNNALSIMPWPDHWACVRYAIGKATGNTISFVTNDGNWFKHGSKIRIRIIKLS